MAIKKESTRQALLLLYPWVLAGLAIRLWRIPSSLVMFRDETAFAFEIKHVLNGTIFQDPTYFVFPPAFAFLAAPIAFATGNAELAGRLISCIAGAATAIPVYYLAKNLFGQRAATIAAALAALFPALISVGVMSEPTYTFFIALGLCMGSKAYNSGRNIDYLLFGAVMAVSYLSRPEGFFVFFAYLAVLVLLLFRDRVGIKRTSVIGAFALAGFFVLAFPYMLQLRANYGAWELSGKTRINLSKMKAAEERRPNETLDEAEERVSTEFNEGKKSLILNLITEFSAMARRYPGNFVTEVQSLSKQMGLPVLLAFITGLVFALSRQGRLRTFAPLIAVAAPLLAIPVVFILDRVLMPYLTVFFVFAAYGASRFSELASVRIKKFIDNRTVVPATTFVFGAALFIGGFGSILPATDVKTALMSDGWYLMCYQMRLAAEHVAPNVVPGSKIITRNNLYAYYAGGEYLPIPVGDINALVTYARKNSARYLIYGPMEQNMRTQLFPYFVKEGNIVEDPLGDGSVKLRNSWNDYFLYEFAPPR